MVIISASVISEWQVNNSEGKANTNDLSITTQLITTFQLRTFQDCRSINTCEAVSNPNNNNTHKMDVNNSYTRSKQTGNSSIMKSMDYCPSLLLSKETTVDASDVVTQRFTSLNLNEDGNDISENSFLLIDGSEELKVSSPEQFLQRLRIHDKKAKVKVVSIFGNTGDGKSYTLNHTFFKGNEVFRTSQEQNSCTMGVWAAFDNVTRVICLDTEGLLGLTPYGDQRMRLLLKVLAVSDIVIYRTRSERLHEDMFKFVGSASRAYSHHFQRALQSVSQRGEFSTSLSALGPAVIIFHETVYTKPLESTVSESAEDILRKQFAKMELKIDAFSSLRYLGIQTERSTLFKKLKSVLQLELENTAVRSARLPHVVYNTLKALNDKFNGEMKSATPLLFPDQYFTCPAKCVSCDSGCQLSMGHLRENVDHHNSSRCIYQHQYENCIYICKACLINGKEVVVTSKVQTSDESSWFSLAKYAWSGYVIECPHCGEIYRSRQYWYGNKNPEDGAVRKEIIHVWPGSKAQLTSQNSAQKVLDGVTSFSEVAAVPTKMVTSWVTDRIAPKYWRPNNEITHCHGCKKEFTCEISKHHCRACGEGFCTQCSSHLQPVPSRGWFSPVRVCNACYDPTTPATVDSSDVDDTEVRVRKYGEAVINTLTSVASVLEYPREFIKDTARPSYWVPDSETKQCVCCQKSFSNILPLHHCRDCGKGVCANCSTNRVPVPHRGWASPVRVCDSCCKQD